MRSDAENAASWRLRNADVTGITPSSMACCYSFEDDNSGKITATYADASGNNLYLQDSGNSSGGQQRGSSAPLLNLGGTASTGKLFTV